jgi:hypothetical protein
MRGTWVAVIVDIIPVLVAGLASLLGLLRSGRARALVRSIFSRPRTESTLIKIDNRWVDVDNPSDATKGHIPAQREPNPPTPNPGPVRSGYDSRNGGPDDHG